QSREAQSVKLSNSTHTLTWVRGTRKRPIFRGAVMDMGGVLLVRQARGGVALSAFPPFGGSMARPRCLPSQGTAGNGPVLARIARTVLRPLRAPSKYLHTLSRR